MGTNWIIHPEDEPEDFEEFTNEADAMNAADRKANESGDTFEVHGPNGKEFHIEPEFEDESEDELEDV